jgi:hypothetical protein
MPVLIDFLEKRCMISRFIQVHLSELVHIHAHAFRNVVHDRFREKHALRRSKPTECSVAVYIGSANMTSQEHIWTLVRVVNVSETSIHDGPTHVLRKATVIIHIRFESEQLALFSYSNLPSGLERMSLATE